MEKIDFEKDYLVVNKNMQGKFISFRWYPSEKVTREKIDKLITEWNEKQKNHGENGSPAELITDQLVREICAYKHYGQPLEEILRDAKEVQGNIDQAVENLDYAVSVLNRIRGLEL